MERWAYVISLGHSVEWLKTAASHQSKPLKSHPLCSGIRSFLLPWRRIPTMRNTRNPWPCHRWVNRKPGFRRRGSDAAEKKRKNSGVSLIGKHYRSFINTPPVCVCVCEWVSVPVQSPTGPIRKDHIPKSLWLRSDAAVWRMVDKLTNRATGQPRPTSHQAYFRGETLTEWTLEPWGLVCLRYTESTPSGRRYWRKWVSYRKVSTPDLWIVFPSSMVLFVLSTSQTLGDKTSGMDSGLLFQGLLSCPRQEL